MDIIFPEFHQAVTKHSDYSYELLKLFPAPEKMIEAGFEKLIAIKRLTVKHAQQKVDEVMAEINSVIVTVPGISNRLGSIILAEIRNIMPLTTLPNYKHSLG